MNVLGNKNYVSKITLILSMFIFGTIGIFRKYIPLPSSVIALVRGFVGLLFLLLLIVMKGSKISREAIKRNLLYLCLSGALLGFNWILLFEAYQYTSVATATLCYYMAPIFVIVASPVLLKERLPLNKVICVIVALIGMVFVSGVLEVGITDLSELKGILLGLGAAIFYAIIVLLNKKMKNIPAYDMTIMQLGVATIVLMPYTLLTEDITTITLSPLTVGMILFVGVLHTGVAYALYFGSITYLKAQTVALFSYIDPIVAIILSALFLQESIGLLSMIGAALVLGSTLISELPEKAKINEMKNV